MTEHTSYIKRTGTKGPIEVEGKIVTASVQMVFGGGRLGRKLKSPEKKVRGKGTGLLKRRVH